MRCLQFIIILIFILISFNLSFSLGSENIIFIIYLMNDVSLQAMPRHLAGKHLTYPSPQGSAGESGDSHDLAARLIHVVWMADIPQIVELERVMARHVSHRPVVVP